MIYLRHSDIKQLEAMQEAGILDRLLLQVKHKLALNIVETPLEATAAREDLYMLSKTLDVVKATIEEHVINYNNEQEID